MITPTALTPTGAPTPSQRARAVAGPRGLAMAARPVIGKEAEAPLSTSQYGKFLGCPRYPTCRGTRPAEDQPVGVPPLTQ